MNMAPIQPDSIPRELRDRFQWVNWTYRVDEKSVERKVPLNPRDGSNASVNHPTSWADFDSAMANVETGRCAGIGFMLTQNDPYAVIDIDNPVGKVDPSDIDRVYRIGNALIGDANSYTEVSPSGNGIHIWMKADIPPNGVRSSADSIELYSTARFMTVTGNAYGEAKPINQADELARALHGALDTCSKPHYDVIEKPCNRDAAAILNDICDWKNGAEFERKARLDFGVEDDSGVDQAVMNAIVFACQNVEKARECFSMTPRANRDKWRTRKDYQDATIRRAFDKLANGVKSIDIAALIASGSETLAAFKNVASVAEVNAHMVNGPPAKAFPIAGRDELIAGDVSELANQWRMFGVLPARGTAAIHGASGSGKSFLALDMACAIAEGTKGRSRWAGQLIEAAPVLYVVLEGAAGFKARAKAWEQNRARNLPEGLKVLSSNFALNSKDDVERLIETIPNGTVVFIDTLAQAAPGMDENLSRDMGEVVSAIQRIASARNALAVLIHHSTKAEENRTMRGHGSLYASLDAVIEVSRSKDTNERYWTAVKTKDGGDRRTFSFTLETVELGSATFAGETIEITSCVCAHSGPVDASGNATAGPTRATPESQRALRGNDQIVFKALNAVIGGLKDPMHGASKDEWYRGFEETDYGKGNKAATVERTFSRSMKSLLKNSAIMEMNGRYMTAFAALMMRANE